MRTSTAFAALAAAALASALSLRGGGHDDAAPSSSSLHQTVLFRDGLAVPGESPLQYCESPSDDWVMAIESVDLTPNPPAAGRELVIKATGTIKETIEKGAYVLLQVKYNYIRLINMHADLCDQMKNVDLECPIEAGKLTVIKSVDLPKEIPPGKYTVLGDVYTKDDVHITCLTATVVFSNNGALGGALELDL